MWRGGFQAVVTSDVLIGAGLSSSAAFETLMGTILSELFNDGKISPIEIAIEENLHAIVQKEIGFVFAKVLECAGVYKRTPEGQAAFKKFLECI